MGAALDMSKAELAVTLASTDVVRHEPPLLDGVQRQNVRQIIATSYQALLYANRRASHLAALITSTRKAASLEGSIRGLIERMAEREALLRERCFRSRRLERDERLAAMRIAEEIAQARGQFSDLLAGFGLDGKVARLDVSDTIEGDSITPRPLAGDGGHHRPTLEQGNVQLECLVQDVSRTDFSQKFFGLADDVFRTGATVFIVQGKGTQPRAVLRRPEPSDVGGRGITRTELKENATSNLAAAMSGETIVIYSGQPGTEEVALGPVTKLHLELRLKREERANLLFEPHTKSLTIQQIRRRLAKT